MMIIMEEHKRWFFEAESMAQKALCLRAKCGSVIVRDGTVLGSGYNAPPLDDIAHSKCLSDDYDRNKKPKYDLTCCIHAEWRAITDALRSAPDLVKGAILYYVRLGDDGHLRHSGVPFCTVCSRLALDLGIRFFSLWHADGIKLYDTKDYNDLSYSFHKF